MESWKKSLGDDALLSSFVDVSAGEERLKNLIADAPGKKELGDDEVPDVLYAVQYFNIAGKMIDSRLSDKPLDVVEYGLLDQGTGKKPVIEIRTRVSATDGKSIGGRGRMGHPPPMPQYYPPGMDDGYDGGRGPSWPEVGYPDRGGDNLKVFKAEKPEMVVHSPYLRAAISAAVGYYSTFSSSGDEMVIEAPYQVLVHHWKALEKYKDSQPESHGGDYAATTKKHIEVLLGFLEQTFSEKIEAEEHRWNNSSGGTATFDMFWLLLKPGSIVYQEHRGHLVPRIISAVLKNDQVRAEEAYVVDVWDIVFERGRLRRRMHKATIYTWNGERTISTLPLIPARFVPDGEKEVAEKQIALGKVYWELSKQPCYREYNGEVVGKSGRKMGNHTGRVIVDCEGFERFHRHENSNNRNYPDIPMGRPPPQRLRLDALPQNQPHCCCKACVTADLPSEPSPFAGFDNLDPNQAEIPANADLYFHILTDTIEAFVLGQRTWAHVRVEALSDITPDPSAFNSLVLDPEIKLTVRALIGKFAALNGKVSPWPSDFVKHKGEGRIFLLHGSPGVGKTCTAECISELTRRPLLSLTSGDISTSMSAGSVERSLSYFLTLGERFGALVLLDEADVYLEARRTRDLQRNALVSMFLRALEYYKGVLFLTTNRVEAFDSAFTSRIHVALHYKKLGDKDRARIWISNFERLERDSDGRCLVSKMAQDYVLKSSDVQALRLNGREIRNALQTAVALAETEALEASAQTITVGEKHLRAVVKMSGGFKSYLYLKNKGTGGAGDDDDDDELEEQERRGLVDSEESGSEREDESCSEGGVSEEERYEGDDGVC
ncbi:P-loop containing nucleoside triphosphate hydrolase protein [Immersiella caudata]|uniref:P-loop containing nucleoside triphosphate hydrolase protein n=1 Tax=Immersiella caudata TaxID=314043 RepID=A0AA39XFG3_9PEZI|nr:P-loop containing nucleoside triphosphate hydrolase protein [Immersiella caudata]